MTVWGAYTNYLRIGLDISTDAISHATTSTNVYVTWTVQCDPSYNFNDSQTLVMTSPQSDQWTFQNTLQGGQTIQFGHTIANQGLSYSGGPTWNFASNLQGVYLGAGPSLSYNWTLPARPAGVPSPPGGATFSSILATQVNAAWTGSPDNQGSAIDNYTIHVANNSAMNPYQQDLGGNSLSRTITGLAPGTTYWTQTFAHNGIGWSGPSTETAFTTNAYQLGSPVWSNIQATTATLTWGNPPTSDAAVQYNLQIATDSGFTNLVGNFTNTFATNFLATGLTPNTTYYSRVRASTSTGWGAWSATSSAKTLSGAKIMRSGTWIDAPGYVYRSGTWVAATSYVYRNGVWVPAG